MLVVVAVGGNALLERGQVPLAETQEKNVAVAVGALAPLAADHDLVVTFGNGPQVGLLANESSADPVLPFPCSLDVLGAQAQGMIGYFLLQGFENALPGRQVASLICQVKVYTEAEGRRLAGLRGWQIGPDGSAWRRVVASPEPVAIVELPVIRTLLGDGAIVICAGGGGAPVLEDDHGHLHGAEAVIDKDLSTALLARDLGADALVILTDVARVETGFGTDAAKAIGRTTPAALRALKFPAGSMGPKVEAACRFTEATGKPAMIGQLTDAAGLIRGTRGTVVEPDRGARRPS
jgi:carbamate kinase